jgi:hypothetical protein
MNNWCGGDFFEKLSAVELAVVLRLPLAGKHFLVRTSTQNSQIKATKIPQLSHFILTFTSSAFFVRYRKIMNCIWRKKSYSTLRWFHWACHNSETKSL